MAGRCDFLTFARNDQRISYASSFGVSILPKERKNEFVKNLEQFKTISVREKQGAKIVGDLTGKRAEVVLDPTLLLDENEWKKVEKNGDFDCEVPVNYTNVDAMLKEERRKSIEFLNEALNH